MGNKVGRETMGTEQYIILGAIILVVGGGSLACLAQAIKNYFNNKNRHEHS